MTIAKAQPELADMPASGIGRIVRRFIAAGLHEPDLIDYVFSYADPTAREAIRNVDRERGW